MRLLIGAALAVDMSKRNIDERLKELPNVFGIADGHLIVEDDDDNDSIDHDKKLCRILQICSKENLNLHKDKYILHVSVSLSFEISFPDMAYKLIHISFMCLKKCHHQSCRRNYNNYLHHDLYEQYSLATLEICELLCRLPSVKSEWTWNRTYHYPR